MVDSVQAAKAALRNEILARRATRTPQERLDAAEQLALHAAGERVLLAGQRIACYMSLPTEPGTHRLISAMRARGVEVLVPVSNPLDHSLDWVAVNDNATKAGAMNISEPTGTRLGPAALQECELAFVPALAVDYRGRRLGRGAGYYDRALNNFTKPICALVFEEELIEEVPAEAHDVNVQLALTPAGLFRPQLG